LSPITTTGDLIIGNGTNSSTRLAIGANTYVLTSNGTTASWVAPSGGSGSSISNGTSNVTVNSSGGTVSITTAGTTALTVSTTQNVGIGQTSPSFKLDVLGIAATNGDAVRNMELFDSSSAYVGGGGGIAFGGYYNGTSSAINDFAGIQGFKENSTAGDYAGALRFTTRVNGGSPTERLRLNSTGALVLQGGTTTANGVGIAFPATQSASSNANTLDDYEEGTWTPTIAGDGTEFVGATYNIKAGKYVKVGDVVWISFDLDVITTGVLLNNASVGGLPFAIPSSGNLSNGGGGINYVNGIQQNYVYQSCYPQNNSNYLFITGRTAASTGSIVLASSSFFANSIRLAGFAWYRTTV